MKKVRRSKLLSHLVLLLCLAVPLGHADEMGDKKGIERLLKSSFEKPDAPLTVSPITITGRHAVAGWLQGDRGGRALLKKENGEWVLQACGGDGLKNPDVLEKSGISRGNAKKLVSAIAENEKQLPDSQVKKFSEFQDAMK
jgi:hypothetical protein